MGAAGSGQHEALDVLIASGADLEATDTASGVSLLELTPSPRCRRCPGAPTADPWTSGRAPVQNGDTALHYASYHGHPICVERLLRAGADASKTDSDGRTPWQVAVRGDQGRACVAVFDRWGITA